MRPCTGEANHLTQTHLLPPITSVLDENGERQDLDNVSIYKNAISQKKKKGEVK